MVDGIHMKTMEEPILGGNLPPAYDSRTCRSVYVENIHSQVTEPFLQQFFAAAGLIEGGKLIRNENFSYGFVDYSYQSSASLAILTLNGRHLWAQPLKIDWAYLSVADLSPVSEVKNMFDEMPQPISVGEIKSQGAGELSEASDKEDAKEMKICVNGEESKEKFLGEFSRGLMDKSILSSFRSSLADLSFTRGLKYYVCSTAPEGQHMINMVMLLSIFGSLVNGSSNMSCPFDGEFMVFNYSVILQIIFDPGGIGQNAKRNTWKFISVLSKQSMNKGKNYDENCLRNNHLDIRPMLKNNVGDGSIIGNCEVHILARETHCKWVERGWMLISVLLVLGNRITNQYVPLYYSEMAPYKYRGTLNIEFQLSIAINVQNCFLAKIKGGCGWCLTVKGEMAHVLMIIIGSMNIICITSKLGTSGLPDNLTGRDFQNEEVIFHGPKFSEIAFKKMGHKKSHDGSVGKSTDMLGQENSWSNIITACTIVLAPFIIGKYLKSIDTAYRNICFLFDPGGCSYSSRTWHLGNHFFSHWGGLFDNTNQNNGTVTEFLLLIVVYMRYFDTPCNNGDRGNIITSQNCVSADVLYYRLMILISRKIGAKVLLCCLKLLKLGSNSLKLIQFSSIFANHVNDAAIEQLLPICLSLMKDEFSDVRINIISRHDQVNQVIGTYMLSHFLMTVIINLANVLYSKVRFTIPLLAACLGVGFFDDRVVSLCLPWLKSKVYPIIDELQRIQLVEKHLSRSTNFRNALNEVDIVIVYGADSCAQMFTKALLKLLQEKEDDSILSSIAKSQPYETLKLLFKLFGTVTDAYLLFVGVQFDMAQGRLENTDGYIKKAGNVLHIVEVSYVQCNLKLVCLAQARSNGLIKLERFIEACSAYEIYCPRAAYWYKLGDVGVLLDGYNQALNFQPNCTKGLL